MSIAHRSSILATASTVRPLPEGTVLYLPFDDHPYDLVRGVEPLPGAVYTMRYGEGKFGGGVAVEVGTTNMIGDQYTRFEGWYTFSGSEVKISQGHRFSEIGRSDATRVSTSGGTSTLKYYINVGTPTQGEVISGSVYVKNIGVNDMKVRYQIVSKSVILKPGEWVWCAGTGTADGTSNLQMRFESISADEDIEFLAWGPMLEKRSFPTSFVSGTRATGSLAYPPGIINWVEPWTWSAWVKFSYPSDGTQRGIWIARHANSANNALHLVRRANGDIALAFYGNDLAAPNAVDDDKWHHRVFVWDGTNQIIYEDGKELARRTSDPLNAEVNAVPHGPGGTQTSTLWGVFDGLIDDLVILQRAAPEDEILSWYNAQAPFHNNQDQFGIAL